ncbi:HD domain-containing protein [Solirubrobacter soli]|uniref:HD domain-containing protein n=1 Tax=Solirubrobacter soli TaxID=363832 RepID=UPI0003FFA20A|nr:HD domain-containing protein [Solirubrobacter soli]
MSDYAEVWAAARPYMRARKNDVHVPLSFGYAERLLGACPEADADVVLLGILLHDIGWAVVDQEAIYRDGFGPGMMESDVRIAHEKEGARLARAILEPLGYAASLVDEVAAIIDGHDTRARALSHNDELVKDADRLWRFSVTGVSVACDWFALTPREYAERLVEQFALFFTPVAEEIARAELSETRRALRIEDL